MFYSIFYNGQVHGQFKTKEAAREWADQSKLKNYFIIHVIEWIE